MKVLSTLVFSLFFSQIGYATTITTVESDWTTYRVDLVTDTDYTAFGGGSAGDVFHIFFDFNRAYLPYLGQVNSAWQAQDFDPHTSGWVPDLNTPDPDDYLQFSDLPLRGNEFTLMLNGITFNMGNPFNLNCLDGSIKGFSTGIFGEVNAVINDTFTITDAFMSDNITGYIGAIVDTAPATVPEPGSLALLLLGLAGFATRRALIKR